MKHCPKCSHAMYEEIKNGIRVDKCWKCSGVFLEFSELKHFIDSVSQSETKITVAEVDKWDFRKDHKWRHYTCAWCDTVMNEREFNYWSGIHIDFCKWCGATFLWEWELQEILDHEYSRLHSTEWKALRKKLEFEGKRLSKQQQQETWDMWQITKSPMLYKLIGKFFG